MTKAIKFNLTLDKHPVRDLDDLRGNFNLDDLLTAYHTQLLHRWLEVRGLMDELKQIIAINSRDDKEIAQTLCKIFQVELSEEAIKTAVYPFEFRRRQQQQLEELASQQFSRNSVINKYHEGYERLCKEMLENAENYPFLKAAIDVLWKDYSQLFSVDFDLFFALFIEKSPLTLYSMLGNEAYRQSGLFDNERKDIVFASFTKKQPIIYQKDTNRNWEKITDQRIFVTKINNASGSVKIKDNNNYEYEGSLGTATTLNGLSFQSNTLGDYIEYIPCLPTPCQSFAGTTEGYWKDLQPKGTKCLILNMESGNFVRNAGKNGEELKANDINKNFLILDGIDYKSNNANHALIYMVI